MAMDAERVLLVEDDEVLASLLATQFQNRGVACTVAISGEDALRILETDPNFGIILLDIQLPGKDGFEVLSTIKQDSRIAAIPVIIVSNFSQEADIVWGKKLGATHFVGKASMVPGEIISLAVDTMHNPPQDGPQRAHLIPRS
jgi:CheY-like chemotaxis protein